MYIISCKLVVILFKLLKYSIFEMYNCLYYLVIIFDMILNCIILNNRTTY